MFRPKTLDDFIGNEKAKEVIQLEIDASKKSGKKFRNLGLLGGPGSGKTNIGEIISSEINAQFVYVNATALKDIKSVIDEVKKCDPFGRTVMLIDEHHAIGSKQVNEAFLSAMEYPYSFSYVDKGEVKKYVVPEGVVFIFCTTNIGKLPAPFRSRLQMIELKPYTDEEKSMIVKQVLDNSGVKYDKRVCMEVAKRARSPRLAKKHIETVMNYALVHSDNIVNLQSCHKAFKMLELCPLGTDNRERNYLRYVRNNGPVSANNIRQFLEVDREDFTDIIESYLIKSEMVKVSSKGRVLTKKGEEIINTYDSGV